MTFSCRFLAFQGDLGAVADLYFTATPQRACICKPEMKLHPQGDSGFELQIKSNFQPSDVGCRMQLHRFGDDFQGWTSETPSLPPASQGAFIFYLFPSKTSVTPSAALPNSEPVLQSLTFLPVPEERGLQQR